jgi:signal transduction histidine kinase
VGCPGPAGVPARVTAAVGRPEGYRRGVTTEPLQGTAGELFHVTGDAVVIVDGCDVVAWSPGAASLFGISRDEALAPGAKPLAEHLETLLDLPADGAATRMPLAPYGVLEVRHRIVGPHHLVLMRDVSAEVRRSEGLRAMSRLSRGLLAEDEPGVAAVLQTVASEAKAMTGAAFSALMLLREGTTDETSHFAYDAPRDLFPEQTPRFAGLFAVPIRTRSAVRLADIRDSAAGVGLPGRHPAIGPLCAVPLVAGADVLGVLAIASPQGARPFDAVDEELLVDLAGHAAVAVRWAQGAEREEARARMRAEVLSTARHDIQTPLGAGKGYTNLLINSRDRMSLEQIQTALQALKQCFDRIHDFTERLLMDEQLDVGGTEPQWATVELTPMLAEVVQDAAVVTGRADAVAVRSGPDAPQALAGDPGMVREVVENLVGNALKHAGHAGPITVTVRREAGFVRLDVRDQGPGIADTDQAVIFERWSRSDVTRQSGTAGFGLGLSIVKRLVTAHGGAVGVSSRLGEGATFWVTFPAEQPGPRPAALT